MRWRGDQADDQEGDEADTESNQKSDLEQLDPPAVGVIAQQVHDESRKEWAETK
jgi:hypothetical protein